MKRLTLTVALVAAACSATDTDDAGVGQNGGDGQPPTAGSDGGGGAGGGRPTDAGPGGDVEILHELTEITIEGRVTVGATSGPGPRIEVIARCGASEVATATDDGGNYSLNRNVQGCNWLVVEFRKESYLPVIKVVPLPPPASPVTLNVRIAQLKELQCGATSCVVEGDPVSRFPPGPMSRGWVATMTGSDAVEYFGGEFRDTQDNVLWSIVFGYFDFRDADGRPLPEFPAFDECVAVRTGSLDQIVDSDPGRDNGIQMPVYVLQPDGRWARRGTGYVGLTAANPGDGPRVEPAEEANLGNIRSGQEIAGKWVCGPIGGSGWIAWGVSIAERTCVSVKARNQCGRGVPNVVYEMRGQDYGFRAITWTDRRGEACLELARSEPVGEDFNANALRGETFWVDVELAVRFGTERFPSIEAPRDPASCAAPEDCLELTHEFFDHETRECP